MVRPPPRSTRTTALVRYTTVCRAGTRQGRARTAAAEAMVQAARLRPPMRRAQPGMGGDDGHATAVGHAGGKGFDLIGTLDDAEPITQPGDQSAGEVCPTCQRVGDVLVDLPGNGAEHAVVARHGGDRKSTRLNSSH